MANNAGMDSKTTLQDIKDAVRDMCLYRGWGGEKAIQNPQRMAMAMVIELGELMEHFAWLEPEELQNLVDGKMPARRDHIMEELADIMIYAFQLARGLDMDISDTMLKKIDIVRGRRDDPNYGRTHPHVESDR